MKTSQVLFASALVIAGSIFGVAGCGDDSDGGGGSGAANGNSGGGGQGGDGQGGDGQGGDGQGGDGQGGSAAAADCETYCTTIGTNCTEANEQYSSKDACLAICATFPQGMPGDKMGHSVECHAYHATAAAGDGAAMHCPHAGPSGAGVCGDTVENFCSIAATICPDIYQSEMACGAAAAEYDDSVPYSTAATMGDSLACRLYHLTAAGVDATTHCPHIAVDSGPCAN